VQNLLDFNVFETGHLKVVNTKAIIGSSSTTFRV